MKKNQKLKRSEGFFGLHFDFHANENCKNIGGNTTVEMIEDIIKAYKPDYIQCDCKGHRGFSSYPTKTGNPAPHITKDALKIWREATEKHNVTLVVHYSGIQDFEYVKNHPENACLNSDMTPNEKSISIFKDYIKDFLIPQLCELAGEYHVDAVWIDGDCWGECYDYGEEAAELFYKETGIKKLPLPGEENYGKFAEVLRKAFFDYLRTYTDEVHKRYSNFEIASNWAFTASHMPLEVCAEVDFLSGDVIPKDCINSARLDARYLAQQNMPWDLMSWGANISGSDKSEIQLMQEAAVILSQGGGYQIYYHQNPDGSVSMDKCATAGKLSEFCFERKEYCFRSKTIPQIALLLSSDSLFSENMEYLYWFGNGVLDGVKGMLKLLLENHFCVSVVSEHHLKNDIDKYPLLVVPEWRNIKIKDLLREYVKNGGNIIFTGSTIAAEFGDLLGVRHKAFVKDSNLWIRDKEHRMSYVGLSDYAQITCEGAEIIDSICHTRIFDTEKTSVGATLNKYGKGMAAGIYFDFQKQYKNLSSFGVKNFVDKIVRSVYKPDIELLSDNFLDITYSCLGDKITVGLVNVSGSHENPNVNTFTDIVPQESIVLTIKIDKIPSSVLLQPNNRKVRYAYNGGILTVMIEKVEIYDILVIE